MKATFTLDRAYRGRVRDALHAKRLFKWIGAPREEVAAYLRAQRAVRIAAGKPKKYDLLLRDIDRRRALEGHRT